MIQSTADTEEIFNALIMVDINMLSDFVLRDKKTIVLIKANHTSIRVVIHTRYLVIINAIKSLELTGKKIFIRYDRLLSYYRTFCLMTIHFLLESSTGTVESVRLFAEK